MDDFHTFALEEYRAIQEKIKTSREILSRLESLTIGGVVITFGVLFGMGSTKPGDIPLIAWWAIPSIVIAAAVRCGAYYVYVARLQNYVSGIEGLMRNVGYKLEGFESHNRARMVGPIMGYAANFSLWAALIGISLLLAVLKTIGLPIP
jgi:hypothetical protein